MNIHSFKQACSPHIVQNKILQSRCYKCIMSLCRRHEKRERNLGWLLTYIFFEYKTHGTRLIANKTTLTSHNLKSFSLWPTGSCRPADARVICSSHLGGSSGNAREVNMVSAWQTISLRVQKTVAVTKGLRNTMRCGWTGCLSYTYLGRLGYFDLHKNVAGQNYKRIFVFALTCTLTCVEVAICVCFKRNMNARAPTHRQAHACAT